MKSGFRQRALALLLIATSLGAVAQAPIELHHRLVPMPTAAPRVALTLDACSGQFDGELIAFLIQNGIPATLFVTRRWLDRNPLGVAIIKGHLDLFEVENHGERHIPAVLGPRRKVYGLAGEPDLQHLQREVLEGGRAIAQVMGVTPRWYRGAAAEYDPQSIAEIGRLGYRIAGFSLNADLGATLKRAAIQARLRQVRDGDVIIAHMNKPASDSAEGLASALADLRRAGFTFVRLDQADLEAVAPPAGRGGTPP